MQLNASQLFSNYFHDRKIYKDISTMNTALLFYEIYYKEIFENNSKINARLYFDNDISEFRTIIYEISRQLNIPYITLLIHIIRSFLYLIFNLCQNLIIGYLKN